MEVRGHVELEEPNHGRSACTNVFIPASNRSIVVVRSTKQDINISLTLCNLFFHRSKILSLQTIPNLKKLWLNAPITAVCIAREKQQRNRDSHTALGWMRSVNESFFFLWGGVIREWTRRASGGYREEEHRNVGKWFSRWDLICETVHPKETFSHGSTPWIQIQPATRSVLEGRMHLA